MKEKRYFILGFVSLVAFAIWTMLIQTVDVQPVGPEGTVVGFTNINVWVHKLTGVHMELYTITDWLGLVPVGVCMIFGLVGLIQLVKRRSIRKVDSDILCLGMYYVIVILGYLIFEMVPINYRPILIEGRLEASYPSSTTLLVLSVMPTLAEQASRRLHDRKMVILLNVICICFSSFMVLGRLISGVHWFTDIVGSIMLSIGLFYIYKAVVLNIKGRFVHGIS